MAESAEKCGGRRGQASLSFSLANTSLDSSDQGLKLIDPSLESRLSPANRSAHSSTLPVRGASHQMWKDSSFQDRYRSQDNMANLSFLAGGGRGVRLIQNPNKAWAILNNQTGKILVCNSHLSSLLEIKETNDVRLWDFMEKKSNSKQQTTVDQLFIDPDTGDTAQYNGEVFNLVSNTGNKVTVSVTLNFLADSSRVLVFLEPVEKTIGMIDIDYTGLITGLDEGAESIFQVKNRERIGEHIKRMIPAIELPGVAAGSKKKLACTGKTEDDLHFPVSVIVTREELGSAVEYDCEEGEAGCRVAVWVYSSLSGLILLNESGTITQCDQSLSSLVLGYKPNSLPGLSIEEIIPGFYDEFEVPSVDRTEDDLGCEDLSPSTSICEDPLVRCQSGPPCSRLPTTDDHSPLEEISLSMKTSCQVQPISPHRQLSSPHRQLSSPHRQLSSPHRQLSSPHRQLPSFHRQLSSPPVPSSPQLQPPLSPGQSRRSPVPLHEKDANLNVEESPIFKRPAPVTMKTPVRIPMEVFTSTPALQGGANTARSTRVRSESSSERLKMLQKRSSSEEKGASVGHLSIDENSCSLPTGCFYGLARHSSGSEISILYYVKKVVLRSCDTVYCVWVTRDSEDIAGKTQAHLTLGTSFAMTDTDNSTVRTLETSLQSSQGGHLDVSVSELASGSFNEHYTTLEQIGRGAFGCVRMAYKNLDKKLVVVKFIYKHKVGSENWINSSEGRIPLEASLLTSLDHPGIIRILDIFQNDQFVQMVMEKHGDMDLFEFVDRNPVMEEPLASYIFRQVVEAIIYLHSKFILHRDIKDENIIIDNKFRVKLIDFGSACYFQSGQLFTTFCGTVEYCAPEVLNGEPYDGPQLEMWALGVLLYIIMYGENPFYDAMDTVRGELHPPHLEISSDCWNLILSILEYNPAQRPSLWTVKESKWLTQDCDPDLYRFQDVIPCTEAEIRSATRYVEPLLPPPPFFSQHSASSDVLDEECDDDGDNADLGAQVEVGLGLESTVKLVINKSLDVSVQSASELSYSEF